MDLNLETLKSEILDYLESSEFAIFRSHPGGLEGLPVITWDAERFPDYHMFFETARKAGVKLILFAVRELAQEEVDEAMEELEDSELSREDQRDYENRLRTVRPHIGTTCSLELAFDYNAHLYVYEARPDWYEDFLEVCDELSPFLPVEDEPSTGHDGLGGFYSNN